jgi:hypothetical protein
VKDEGIYEGEFTDSVFDGRGRIIYNTGEYFKGDFRVGLKDGSGKYVYLNGHYHEGAYKNNYRHGIGFIYDGKSYTKGIWLYDKLGKILESFNA